MRFDSTLDVTHADSASTLMAAVPHQPFNQPSPEKPSPSRTTNVLLLLANRFDCEAITRQLAESPSLEVLAATEHLSSGLAQINSLKPQLVIYDPRAHPDGLSMLKELLIGETIEQLIILDERVREGTLIKAVQMPRTSYLTRQSTSVELRQAIESIGATSDPMFAAGPEARVVQNAKGNVLIPRSEHRGLAQLTQREFEVLEHVAAGWTVRQCAAQLNVAVSTIDNHKSKIMKKLGIRKASRLIHLAIREGVVQV